MLFLRNIDEVSWKVEGRDYGSYLRETRDQGDLARFVHILGSKTDIAGVEREHFEQWLVFSREVENEGRPAGSVEIAFSLSEDGKSVSYPFQNLSWSCSSLLEKKLALDFWYKDRIAQRPAAKRFQIMTSGTNFWCKKRRCYFPMRYGGCETRA